jgi:alpha-galactosidase
MKRSNLLVAFIYVFILAFTVSAASLVARYEFENNVNDSTGTYNGTAYNGPTYATGIVGSYAISLDGVNDYVQITRPVAGDFTIAFWIKTTQTAGSGQWWAGAGLVDGDTTSSSRDFGTSLVGSKFAFGIGGTDTTITSTTSINNGQWYHVTAVRTQSAGSFSVYVNGVLENTATGSTSLLNRSATLRIGGILTGSTGSFFNGNIDDLRFYDYVLSASDIATLAGADTTAPTPNPATWAVLPHAVNSSTITMTATTGSDPRGVVKYYFEETSGNPGGNGSGWQDSPVYTDYGLPPMQTYTYVVRMKDIFGNTTSNSAAASSTTGPIADTNGDNAVSLGDFVKLAQEWQQSDCRNNLWCDGADLDINDSVGTSDLLVLAQEWLKSYTFGHFYTWAPTPPMGWNSWDCFGTSVTEDEVKANADYMAQYLKQYGWEYVVVDIQWYEPQVQADPYAYPSQPNTNIDDYGRVWPAVNKHPSSADGNGFMPLADYVHSLGLKFGVHMMRGIPRVAYNRNTPILGTPYTARDIANTGSTCSWNPDMYGVDTTKPGAQEYYNSIMNLMAGWGVDYVKIDDLSRPYAQGEIEAIRNAIDQCGRPIVFSTSPGETPLSSGAHVSQHANLWRISDDFWDSWSALDSQFQRLHDWSQWRADGHYPDADMLPLGSVRTRSNGWTNFTQTEQKTMMTLWAIARSPLMMGGHMPNNDAYTLSLMANSELMEVNQHSINNRSIQNNTYPIWAADVRDSNDMYLAVFNRTSTGPTPVPVTLSNLGIKRCNVRNLWTHTDLGEFTDTFSPNANAHGAELFKLTALETQEIPPATPVLNNSGFDDQVLSDGSWSAAADVWSWNNDAGGDSFTQNLTTAQINPASQSGENTCVIGQQAWIGQNLTYDIGTPVVIEANKTYQVTVWVGRRLGTEGSAAGILTVYLEDATLNTQLYGITYDLTSLSQGAWTQQTFTLSTGTTPAGLGNPLRLGFMNTGTRGAYPWYGQIVIDSVTFTDVTP